MSPGLFEKPEDHYGEIWYEMNGQKIMERSAIEQVVLETIYRLAGVSPPEKSDETAVRRLSTGGSSARGILDFLSRLAFCYLTGLVADAEAINSRKVQ